MMTSTTEHIEAIADHALCTLPDSLSRRRALLNRIVLSLPKGNESRKRALCLLEQMDAMEKLQGEFAMQIRGGEVRS